MDRVEGWRHFFKDDRRAQRFEGLRVDEATAVASREGVERLRVIDLDGNTFITFDLLPSRLNLLVEEGVVALAGWF